MIYSDILVLLTVLAPREAQLPTSTRFPKIVCNDFIILSLSLHRISVCTRYIVVPDIFLHVIPIYCCYRFLFYLLYVQGILRIMPP